MTKETPLAGKLATVSLRALLQKALLRYWQTVRQEPLPPSDTVALSQLQIGKQQECQYATAIAQQLAATHSAPATTLAPQLAKSLTTYFAQSEAQQDISGAIAANLYSQSTQQGWLILTLATSGLTAWLQHWQQVSLVAPAPIAAAVPPVTSAMSGNWPLCDRLHLSLPLLLQWAYARCHTWQTADGVVMVEERSRLPLLPLQQLPRATQYLLPPVIQTVDQIAAHPTTPKVWWRQGYHLAEQVYRYDAERAQCQSTPLEDGAPAWSAATLAATQKVLALILTHSLHLIPRPQL